MKRGLHDSEYEKIRRAAGYGKPQYEFPEIDTEAMFAAERVEAARQDFHNRMDELNRAEAKKAAEVEARHAEFRLKVDRAILLSEYQRLGLEPLEPLISLHLALKLGWSIEQINGKNVLARPTAQQQRKTREQWEEERNAGGT